MRPFHALIPFGEAKRVIMESIFPPESTEEVRLEDCLGRVVAQDVVASLAHPPFNRSAMDGYAVRARDTFGASQSAPKVFNIIGTQLAGSSSDFQVRAGQCIQIATGARMPRGADAVVMVEDAEREAEQLKVSRPVYPQANVSRRGEDIDRGDVILRKESVLDEAKIGVLASQGMKSIRVYQKPRVAVLSSGEEIAQVGEKLKQGQIYDINSYTVSAVVQKSGGLPSLLGITPDDVNSLKSAVSTAVDWDMVVISGGSSVGERDLFFRVLQDLGEGHTGFWHAGLSYFLLTQRLSSARTRNKENGTSATSHREQGNRQAGESSVGQFGQKAVPAREIRWKYCCCGVQRIGSHNQYEPCRWLYRDSREY